MAEDIHNTAPGLGELIKQHLLVLSHDIQSLQNSVRVIESRLTGLAERADIAKIETQIDRLASEKLLLVRKDEFTDVKNQIGLLSLDKDFISGVKGTLGMIKAIVGATGGLIVLLIGAAITLYHQDMEAVLDSENKLSVANHQIAELWAFKHEVEEVGSPILRGAMKEIGEVRLQLAEQRAEVKALSNVFLDAERHRDRPDVQDTK